MSQITAGLLSTGIPTDTLEFTHDLKAKELSNEITRLRVLLDKTELENANELSAMMHQSENTFPEFS